MTALDTATARPGSTVEDDATGPLVIIPTYDEADNIVEAVTRALAAVPAAHVLVVDDSSPDGTGDIVEVLGAGRDDIHLLRRTTKDGLGAAYRAGFAWGAARGYPTMVEMDADLSHDPAALPSLLGGIANGADLVIGSRYVPGGSIPSNWGWHRKVLSRVGNRYAALALRMPIRDATAGFRAYRSSALARLDLDAVRADGYGFQIEMAYRMVKLGGQVAEVPIHFVDRARGQSKMSKRIVLEAFVLVTAWGLRDRVRGRRR